MSELLTASGLTVRYGDLVALHDVDVALVAGRMLAVTGPSGAGKTSLLWALSGLLRPAAGEVCIDGRSVEDRDAAEAAGVVLVPQDNGLATVLTAEENVLVPLLAVGLPAAEARARALAALEDVGLAGAAGQLVEELSGGQQQRVAVARGLAQRGDVVLADEPTSELDAVSRSRVVDLLRAEARRGASVVLASHDPEAAAACDAELRLDEGRPAWVRTDHGPPAGRHAHRQAGAKPVEDG